MQVIRERSVPERERRVLGQLVCNLRSARVPYAALDASGMALKRVRKPESGTRFETRFRAWRPRRAAQRSTGPPSAVGTSSWLLHSSRCSATARPGGREAPACLWDDAACRRKEDVWTP